MNISLTEIVPPRNLWSAHGLHLIVLFALVLLPLYLFGSIAEDVVEKENIFFDNRILLFTHAYATPTLDDLMVFFSQAGSGLILVPFNAFIFALLFWKKQRKNAFFWGVAVCGAALINVLAKYGFSRVRPSLWVSLLPETTFSFPSGHAMQSMAVGTALVILLWKTRWRYVVLLLAVSFVLAVGLSRVYLGVHYPSDILAGWLASLAWVVGLRFVVDNPDLYSRFPFTKR